MHADFLHSWVDGLNLALPNVSDDILLISFLLPVTIALFSRQILVILGSVAAAGAATLVIIKPEAVPFVLWAGAYVVSVLIATIGILARRRYVSVRTKLTKLQAELVALRRSEEQSLLVNLKKQGDAHEGRTR